MRGKSFTLNSSNLVTSLNIDKDIVLIKYQQNGKTLNASRWKQNIKLGET